MKAINGILSVVNDGIRLLQMNAFWVAVATILALHIKRVLDVRLKRRRQQQQSRASEDLGRSSRGKSQEEIGEEMRRIRQEQQEIANEKSLEAEKKRKEKEAQDRERKNKCAKPADPKGGSRLGGGTGEGNRTNTTTSTGFNPMQPWASHSRGYR